MNFVTKVFLLSIVVAAVVSATPQASKISVKQSLLDDIVQKQLPKLLPSKLVLPDIVTNFRKIFTFYFNATNIRIENISCLFNDSIINFLPEKNAVEGKIDQINGDLNLDFSLSSMIFSASGSLVVNVNITLDTEVTFDLSAESQLPNLQVTGLTIAYHEFHISLSGSFGAWILNLIEHSFHWLIKWELPSIIESTINSAIEAVMPKVPYIEFKINQTTIGFFFNLTNPITVTGEALEIDSAAIFVDPGHEGAVQETLKIARFERNFPNSGEVGLALTETTINSLISVLVSHNLLAYKIKGKDIPASSPISLNTDEFELLLPDFYNFYGPGKFVNIMVNATRNTNIDFSNSSEMITFDFGAEIGFSVDTDKGEDTAFILNTSLSARFSPKIQNSNLTIKFDKISLSFDSVIFSKIPNVPVKDLATMINASLRIVINFLNEYFDQKSIELPEIAGIKIVDAASLVGDGNFEISFTPRLVDVEAFKKALKEKK